MNKEFMKGLNTTPQNAKLKVEFLQGEPYDMGLNDGWAVRIDIVRFVEGVNKVSRFCTVYGKDKFEAMTNAQAITLIERI